MSPVSPALQVDSLPAKPLGKPSGLPLGRNRGGTNGQIEPQSSVRIHIVSVLLIAVAGWVPQPVDSEREVCIPLSLPGGPLGWESRRNRIGQTEPELQCHGPKDSAGPGAGDQTSELSQIETSRWGLSGHPPIDLSWMKAALTKGVKLLAGWFSSAEDISGEKQS